ncbi:uncharacterized protein LOC142317555 [Lycorma delicatula]|uniref:uncharacterized protein LOC142317555 n=1 Tax=Lycorma delicatula TaxID=130591 RepID=UPI003F5145BE
MKYGSWDYASIVFLLVIIKLNLVVLVHAKFAVNSKIHNYIIQKTSTTLCILNQIHPFLITIRNGWVVVTAISHILRQGIFSSSVLLSTALVSILDHRGIPHFCCVLLDSGSQSNFATEKIVKKLGLPSANLSVEVNGFGISKTRTSKVVHCVTKTKFNSFSATIDCVVFPSITKELPTVSVSHSHLKIPQNFQLADPYFNQPSEIDLLVGAEFWKIEDCDSEKQHTGHDKLYEELFVKTTTRNYHGKYCVNIPLKGDVCELGESRDAAFRRFVSMERRLSSKPDMHSQYVQFMKEYKILGHTKEITTSEAYSSKVYYIPLRFRTHPFVISGDIEKMYRQVNINLAQQNLQLILWRELQVDPIKTFKLLTITYCTASAPYLATRTLKQLALDENSSFPTASEVLVNDFYVDDVMSGVSTVKKHQKPAS